MNVESLEVGKRYLFTETDTWRDPDTDVLHMDDVTYEATVTEPPEVDPHTYAGRVRGETIVRTDRGTVWLPNGTDVPEATPMVATIPANNPRAAFTVAMFLRNELTERIIKAGPGSPQEASLRSARKALRTFADSAGHYGAAYESDPALFASSLDALRSALEQAGML